MEISCAASANLILDPKPEKPVNNFALIPIATKSNAAAQNRPEWVQVTNKRNRGNKHDRQQQPSISVKQDLIEPFVKPILPRDIEGIPSVTVVANPAKEECKEQVRPQKPFLAQGEFIDAVGCAFNEAVIHESNAACGKTLSKSKKQRNKRRQRRQRADNTPSTAEPTEHTNAETNNTEANPSAKRKNSYSDIVKTNVKQAGDETLTKPNPVEAPTLSTASAELNAPEKQPSAPKKSSYKDQLMSKLPVTCESNVKPSIEEHMSEPVKVARSIHDKVPAPVDTKPVELAPVAVRQTSITVDMLESSCTSALEIEELQRAIIESKHDLAWTQVETRKNKKRRNIQSSPSPVNAPMLIIKNPVVLGAIEEQVKLISQKPCMSVSDKLCHCPTSAAKETPRKSCADIVKVGK